jgi:prefoldin subunit 5
MITTKEYLKQRLDELDAEIEGIKDEIMALQDKITDLKHERNKVANQLDDLLDGEEGTE